MPNQFTECLIQAFSFSDVIQKLPIIADDTYVQDIHREIISAAPWSNHGMKALAQFAWSCTLRAISQYSNMHGRLVDIILECLLVLLLFTDLVSFMLVFLRQNFQRDTTTIFYFVYFPDVSEFCEQDEFLVDQAIQDGVLKFIRESIISTDTFHKEVSGKKTSYYMCYRTVS